MLRMNHFISPSVLRYAFILSCLAYTTVRATKPPLFIDGDPNPNKGYEDDEDKEFKEFCDHQEFSRLMPEKVNKEACKVTNPIDFHTDDLHILFVIFVVLLYGATIRSILRFFHASLPYTVVLMMSGMVVGLISKYYCYELYTYTAIARLHAKVILFTFLPVLLFESSFSIPGHVFLKAAGQVLLLAAPGMLFCTFLSAFVCYTFFVTYEWTFLESIFFGCIISATDPVAVVAILKELGVSETLSVLIDGESLLNDGVAILFYEVIKELLIAEEQGTTDSIRHLIGHVTREFFQIAVGGPIFGFMMAKITIFCLTRVFNDAVVEITMTLVSAYLTYYIGEDVLGVSGVMAVVLLGITMSAEKTCISPETEHEVHGFWGMLGHLANTVLFFITGVIIMERGTRNVDWNDLYYLILLYCALNLIRFVMLLTMSPILTRIGYGMPWQNMIVMMWGGLRGAVGICLSLEVYEDIEFCKRKLGPKILIQTAGIVLLTLVVNGTTTKKLLELLKLTEISPGRMEEMRAALKAITVSQKKALTMFRHDRFLADANWTYVNEHTKIENPYRNAHVSNLKSNEQSSIVSLGPENLLNECPGCHNFVPNQPNNEELKVMTEEARLRVIKAMKISFWSHFERGVLTEEAVQILASTADSVADKPFYMMHAKDLKKYWTVRGFFPYLRETLARNYGENPEKDMATYPEKPEAQWKHRIWYLATASWFDYMITICVLINMVPAFWQMVIESQNVTLCISKELQQYRNMFRIVNFVFTVIYGLEFVIKVIGRGCYDYWKSKWNWLDFLVLSVSIADVAISLMIGCNDEQVNRPLMLNFVKFVRAIRIFRALKLLRPLIPALMNVTNSRINTQLFLGYDIALGFIVACDDVIKFLPQMIDNKRVFNKIKANVEKERMETVREMGILQKEHPGIAIAIKTRHASRSVLNQMKATLYELRVDGLLDEKENDLLTIVLEERMKRLWNSPAYIPPPSPEVLLENLNWVYGHAELKDYIFKNATLLQYESSDVIVGINDPPVGVYVIVSGMIKINYDPIPEVVHNRTKFGAMPCMEIFKDFDFDKRTEDFFSSGTVIGESTCLTGRRRAASVICETEGVSAYHIPLSVLKEALKSFNDQYDSLEERMWRACGIRRATAFLSTYPAYQTMPKEKLDYLLERTCVPIGPEFERIVIPPYIQDVVVIEGKVENELTGDIYVAPYVIPRSCPIIKMCENPMTVNRVLIIMAENQGPEDFDDSESSLGKCILTAKNQRRHSIPDDKNDIIIPGTEEGRATPALTGKDKQKRYSLTVNFGVRQKTKRKSSAYTASTQSDYTKRLGASRHSNVHQP